MTVKTRYKIMAISGSTRKNSANETILRFIADHFKERLDVALYDGIDTLPHFNPDIDEHDLHDNVKNFREQIEKSDGAIICTPEYVFSLPGVLKNAIEWTVSTTVFSDKPVALIVASGLGDKAYESLILIMKTLQATIAEHSTLLINGARSKINPDGQIIDKQLLSDIDTLVNSFIASIEEQSIADFKQ